ncbi:AAA family ATPase [Candidatus Endobugula sertula]|uniref:AAA family ATPase n=1 Tax=Candidatus Endobugula sertula TaxID=62101 RepID=A0A1D2QP98_9GAMM|nr:AAA family ATPase [Candidatus Endobugula sertula]
MLLNSLKNWLEGQIVGQQHLTDRLLIALLADGHLLVEGAPGLAKTKAIKHLSEGIEANFQRIQFTPDLLPTDITGTDIYNPQEHQFDFQPGPIFHNLVLADEINRAPAKVQSALLEAMAERQISVGNNTYQLPELFLVMATQNPIEQEGTYPLPEAQLDRFLMQVNIEYPDTQAEAAILQLARAESKQSIAPPTQQLTIQELLKARQEVMDIHSAPTLDDYIVQLTMATRHPDKVDSDLARWIEFGISPRATIALDRCAKAHAWMQDRDYVTPDDIHSVIYDVFRHRLLLSFEAEAQSVSADHVISQLLEKVAIV